MNDTYLLAFITDPNFGRVLIAMMIMAGAVCLFAVWGIYKNAQKA
jgi:HAMP domain-containing protein